MAFTREWNEGEPVGSLSAAQNIDEIIRELKADLRERLEQVIPDFGDDDADPKRAAWPSRFGIAENRPEAPAFNGDGYLATDTKILSVGFDGEWIELKATGVGGGGGGTGPQAPTVVLTPASGVVTPGTNVTFTATPTDPDGSVLLGSYAWYVNGVVQAGETDNTFQYPINVTSTVKVIFTDQTGLTAQAESTQSAGTGAVNPPTDFNVVNTSSCETGPVNQYTANLTWRSGVADSSTKIYRNGVHIATQGPNGSVSGIFTYEDTSLAQDAPGVITWQLTTLVGTNESTPVTRTLNVIAPCSVTGTQAPLNLTAADSSYWPSHPGTVPAVKQVTLEWTNTHSDKQIRVYRNDILAATLAAGTTFVNQAVSACDVYYSFYVKYVESDGVTTGPPSNVATEYVMCLPDAP